MYFPIFVREINGNTIKHITILKCNCITINNNKLAICIIFYVIWLIDMVTVIIIPLSVDRSISFFCARRDTKTESESC